MVSSEKKGWFSRNRRIIVTLTLATVCFTGICLYFLIQQRMRKFHYFAIYANATNHYIDKHGRLPDTLEAVEAEYNNYDGRYYEIPARPWHLHPSFRPLKGLKGGPYLFLVENPVPGFPEPTRWVIYVEANQPTLHLENIWEWELDDRTLADNELRVRNQARHPRPRSNHLQIEPPVHV